jgi:hypothetical protein
LEWKRFTGKGHYSTYYKAERAIKMIYSEKEYKRLLDSNYADDSVEHEIELNLLNFIRVIHLNGQDFYTQSFGSQYFGDLEMTFKKNSNCLVGHCRAENKKKGIVVNYLFTENGFELVDVVLPKQVNENSILFGSAKRLRTDTQRIEAEVKVKLNKAAFYLSKFEHQGLFERNLNQGETIKKIANMLGVKVNTLKNKRDQYDPYCSNTRIGWVRQTNLSEDMLQVYDQYKNKSKDEIKEEILIFLS